MSLESVISAKLKAKEAAYDVLIQELVVLVEKAEDLDGDKFNADTLSNLGNIVTTAVKAGVIANEVGLLRNLEKENRKSTGTKATPAPAPAKKVTPKKHEMFHNG